MLKLFLVCIFISLAGSVHAQETFSDVPQIQQAQLLIESGKPEEAYLLLQPLELEQAGNIRYDYLLGISALNSGKASQAVFALERVQESDPEYGDAGLWLSIALYRSGDMERAKSGFNSVLTKSQNLKSKASAKEYLASISQLEAADVYKGKNAANPLLLGKVEFGIGYDDNISNNNPGSTQSANTLLTRTSNLGGMESMLNLGLEGRIPIAGNYAFLSVDDGIRKYHDHGVMNSATLIAKGGVNFTGDTGNVYRINLARRDFRQQGNAEAAKDNDNDYDIYGLEGNSRIKISEHDFFGFLAQLNHLRILTNSSEDTNQVMLGANYMHLFQVKGNPVFYLGYIHLVDTAVRQKAAYDPTYNNGLTNASHVSKNYTLYLQYSITQNVDIFFSDYINYRRDTGAFARDPIVVFGDDKTRYYSIGLNWRPWSSWTLGVQVASTSSTSNISLFSYNKTESRITLKRDFSM